MFQTQVRQLLLSSLFKKPVHNSVRRFSFFSFFLFFIRNILSCKVKNEPSDICTK